MSYKKQIEKNEKNIRSLFITQWVVVIVGLLILLLGSYYWPKYNPVYILIVFFCAASAIICGMIRKYTQEVMEITRNAKVQSLLQSFNSMRFDTRFRAQDLDQLTIEEFLASLQESYDPACYKILGINKDQEGEVLIQKLSSITE